jgi:hypothetical protein
MHGVPPRVDYLPFRGGVHAIRKLFGFITHEMHVIIARVDESHAGDGDGRPTARIVALIEGYRPRRDDDGTVTWMNVPAGALTGMTDVLLHMDVRRLLGFLSRQPNIAVMPVLPEVGGMRSPNTLNSPKRPIASGILVKPTAGAA